MFAYEFFPAYIFPWLNSISIPCLAAMHATGAKAATLTNIFGGASNNEGLGLFSLSLDWQYVRSQSVTVDHKLTTSPSADHFFSIISSAQAPATSRYWVLGMLHSHGCNLLR
jgi:hypothetical protein